jgi:hypothetical protein
MSETEKEQQQQQYVCVPREPFEELLKALHEARLALRKRPQLSRHPVLFIHTNMHAA